VFLTRWPRGAHPDTLEPSAPFQQLAQVEPDGQFRISGLPPGEYRIAAFSMGPGTNIMDPATFRRLMARVETITLERGATKSIELKLVDISN
jgi:hypothetical protein